MVPISFGSEGPKIVRSDLSSSIRLGIAIIVSAAALLLFFFFLVFFAVRAFAGCTTIPSTSQLVKRNDICAALGLKPQCFFVPRKLIGGTIFSYEGFYALNVNNRNVGVFKMDDALPVDHERCSDVQYIEDLLKFHTGSPEIQAALKKIFSTDLIAGDVVYFDEVMGTEPDPGLCIVQAQLMVVHK